MPTEAYDPEPFQTLLRELLEQAGETVSHAAQAAGMSHASILTYLKGSHPSKNSCFLLADHFQLSPNMVLELAGYEPMSSFEHLDEFNPDVRAFAARVQGVEDANDRNKVVAVVRAALELVRCAELETTCPKE